MAAGDGRERRHALAAIASSLPDRLSPFPKKQRAANSQQDPAIEPSRSIKQKEAFISLSNQGAA
jgi:hypothetical protein